jgi:hypothetical protein
MDDWHCKKSEPDWHLTENDGWHVINVQIKQGSGEPAALLSFSIPVKFQTRIPA